MATGDVWIHLEPTSILALGDLTTRHRDVLIKQLADLRSELYGAADGTVGTVKASMSQTTSRLTLSASAVGVTALGDRIDATFGAGEWTSIPFQNTGGVTYYIGARRQLRPSAVTAATIDGIPAYSRMVEDVGEMGAPDLVTVNGAGLRFRVDTLVKHVWAVVASRPAIVWMLAPKTGGVQAIYTGTAAPDGGGHIVIDCPHVLGQTGTPSTTAADYVVLIKGPTITSTNLTALAPYWVIGTCLNGTFSSTAQGFFTPWGSWLSLFAVEHDQASGAHNVVSADGYTYKAAASGKQGTFQVPAGELAAYLGTCFQSGGTAQTMAYTAAGGGSPAYIATTGTIGSPAKMRAPLRMAPDQAFTIDSLVLVSRMTNAGSSNAITLRLIERSFVSATETTLGAWTFANPGAATWGSGAPSGGPAFPFAVTAPAATLLRYWEIEFTEPNAGNARLAGFYGTISASKVSPVPH